MLYTVHYQLTEWFQKTGKSTNLVNGFVMSFKMLILLTYFEINWASLMNQEIICQFIYLIKYSLNGVLQQYNSTWGTTQISIYKPKGVFEKLVVFVKAILTCSSTNRRVSQNTNTSGLNNAFLQLKTSKNPNWSFRALPKKTKENLGPFCFLELQTWRKLFKPSARFEPKTSFLWSTHPNHSTKWWEFATKIC